MRVLIACLIYGDRPLDVLQNNIANCGYPANYVIINREGIANALNDAITIASIDDEYDAVAFLANDIIEPENWLAKKVEALQTYPKAGIVASSLDNNRQTIQSEHIISNWLLSMEVVNSIGYFNDQMFPYGPIDLDYCERANLAGFYTYYVMNCLAEHKGSHATGSEYGWDKAKLVEKYWQMHVDDITGYRNGTKNIMRWKQEKA